MTLPRACLAGLAGLNSTLPESYTGQISSRKKASGTSRSVNLLDSESWSCSPSLIAYGKFSLAATWLLFGRFFFWCTSLIYSLWPPGIGTNKYLHTSWRSLGARVPKENANGLTFESNLDQKTVCALAFFFLRLSKASTCDDHFKSSI